jgi:hypothetical protein
MHKVGRGRSIPARQPKRKSMEVWGVPVVEHFERLLVTQPYHTLDQPLIVPG